MLRKEGGKAQDVFFNGF